jgi:hypothetical protein
MRVSLIFRFAVCGFLAASAVAAQQAQAPADPAVILKLQREQTAQLAATWLHSGDPRLQAWGAYVALRDQHRQLIPDLLALANEYEVSEQAVPRTGRAKHDAMLAILDALIQFNPAITGDESARLYPEFPTQSLILLRRAGMSSNSFLLEVFRTEHSQHGWLAAGNMLAERKARGFASAVLRSMTVHATIRVGTSSSSGEGVGWACDYGPGDPKGKSDWPEIGTYSLVDHVPGVTLLVDGADPVYFYRSVSALYDRDRHDNDGCYGFDAESWDLIREHYLTRLLDGPQEDPPLKSSVHRTMIWKNGEAYVAYLRGVVQQQQAAFAELALRLKDCHLMTEDEFAAAKQHLEITIIDDRQDKRTPLPRAENLGENVIVKM